MYKMERKGIASIVSYILIILLTVTAISIFIGYYISNLNKGTKDERALCFGMDLEVTACTIFNSTVLNFLGLPDTGYGILASIERHPGGGDLAGIRLIIKDSNGNTHTEAPLNMTIAGFKSDTDFSDLVEYNAVDIIVRNLSYTPVSYGVAAVVGESETVCSATRTYNNCAVYTP